MNLDRATETASNCLDQLASIETVDCFLPMTNLKSCWPVLEKRIFYVSQLLFFALRECRSAEQSLRTARRRQRV